MQCQLAQSAWQHMIINVAISWLANISSANFRSIGVSPDAPVDPEAPVAPDDPVAPTSQRQLS